MVAKATVDKQKILIGETIQLELECTVPAGAPPLTWSLPDSLPHFEWMNKGSLDSVIRPDQRYYRQQITVTSFDSGAWTIPSFYFLSGNNRVASDSIRIEVGYSKFNAQQDYHDIKDIVDIPNPIAPYIGWIVAGFTVLSLALVIWLVRKKKLLKGLAGETPAVPRLSPYEEAIQQLTMLEKQGMSDGAAKEFYSRLNDVLRLFVWRKLGISSLAETNEELIGQLRQQPLDRTVYDELAETLRMSDFVKFAKFQPGQTDGEHSLRVIRRSVDKLNAIGEEEGEKEEKPQRTGEGLSNSPRMVEDKEDKKKK